MDEFLIIDNYDLDDSDRNTDIGSPQFKLFNYWHDEIPYSYLIMLLEESWQASAIDTMRIIFYVRNCRGGRGSREHFYNACQWLAENHPDSLIKNIRQIPNFGYWGDLWSLWPIVTEQVRAAIIFVYAEQLQKDLNNDRPTLAAKWAPTENKGIDKEWGIVKLLCEQLGWSRKRYRKNIAASRRKLGMIENTISQGWWGELEFDKLSEKYTKRFYQPFFEHCGIRYQQWYLSQLKKTKFATLPHHIIENLRLNKNVAAANKSWEEITESTTEFNALAICDVGPSMYPLTTISAIDVALAMSLFISTNATFKLENKIMSFSEHPILSEISGDTMTQQLISLLGIDWGKTLDIPSALEQMLEKQLIPEEVYIFTDKDWYSQDLATFERDYFTVLDRYAERGFAPPKKIYYWQINPTNKPFIDLEYYNYSVIIINGFSEQFCSVVLNGYGVEPNSLYQLLIDSTQYTNIQI